MSGPYMQHGGWAMDDNDPPWIIICDSREQAERVLRDRQAMEALRAMGQQDRGMQAGALVIDALDQQPDLADDIADFILAAKEADSE